MKLQWREVKLLLCESGEAVTGVCLASQGLRLSPVRLLARRGNDRRCRPASRISRGWLHFATTPWKMTASFISWSLL